MRIRSHPIRNHLHGIVQGCALQGVVTADESSLISSRCISASCVAGRTRSNTTLRTVALGTQTPQRFLFQLWCCAEIGTRVPSVQDRSKPQTGLEMLIIQPGLWRKWDRPAVRRAALLANSGVYTIFVFFRSSACGVCLHIRHRSGSGKPPQCASCPSVSAQRVAPLLLRLPAWHRSQSHSQSQPVHVARAANAGR